MSGQRQVTVKAPAQALLSETANNDEAFAKGTKWSQRVYPHQGAVDILNKTIKEGEVRPLAVVVDYYDYDWGRLFVLSDFRRDYEARVVLVEQDGSLSLSKKAVGSVDEVKGDTFEDKPIADATVLVNSAFMEKNLNLLLIFRSKNAGALTGGKKFREQYYLAGVGKSAASAKVSTADPEAMLREEQQRLSITQQKLLELQDALDVNKAEVSELEKRILELRALVKDTKDFEAQTEEKKRELAARAAKLVRN